MGGFLAPLIFAVSPNPTPVITGVSTADVVYKHPLEIWLDTLRDEYEQDVSRSPLERGVLLSETRTLDTCLAFSEGALNVSNSSASVIPLAPISISPAAIDIGGVRGGALDPNRDVRARGIEIVTRWNTLEAQLANILNNRRSFPTKGLTLHDRSVVSVLIERWAKMQPQDPDNVDFDTAVTVLGLPDEDRRLLKSAGTTDLRSIARALQAAPALESYNANVQTRQKGDRKAKAAADSTSFALSAAKANEMKRAIGDALAKSLDTKSEG
jgi:hypothetical protein